jgi:hypothetical protein
MIEAEVSDIFHFDFEMMRLLVREYFVNIVRRDNCKPEDTVNIHSFIHSSMALQPLAGLWPLIRFRNLFLHRR